MQAEIQSAWGSRGERVQVSKLTAYCNYLKKKIKIKTHKRLLLPCFLLLKTHKIECKKLSMALKLVYFLILKQIYFEVSISLYYHLLKLKNCSSFFFIKNLFYP